MTVSKIRQLIEKILQETNHKTLRLTKPQLRTICQRKILKEGFFTQLIDELEKHKFGLHRHWDYDDNDEYIIVFKIFAIKSISDKDLNTVIETIKNKPLIRRSKKQINPNQLPLFGE